MSVVVHFDLTVPQAHSS